MRVNGAYAENLRTKTKTSVTRRTRRMRRCASNDESMKLVRCFMAGWAEGIIVAICVYPGEMNKPSL